MLCKVPAIIYAMFYYIGLHCNGTQQYYEFKFPFHTTSTAIMFPDILWSSQETNQLNYSLTYFEVTVTEWTGKLQIGIEMKIHVHSICTYTIILISIIIFDWWGKLLVGTQAHVTKEYSGNVIIIIVQFYFKDLILK